MKTFSKLTSGRKKLNEQLNWANCRFCFVPVTSMGSMTNFVCINVCVCVCKCKCVYSCKCWHVYVYVWPGSINSASIFRGTYSPASSCMWFQLRRKRSVCVFVCACVRGCLCVLCVFGWRSIPFASGLAAFRKQPPHPSVHTHTHTHTEHLLYILKHAASLRS